MLSEAPSFWYFQTKHKEAGSGSGYFQSMGTPKEVDTLPRCYIWTVKREFNPLSLNSFHQHLNWCQRDCLWKSEGYSRFLWRDPGLERWGRVWGSQSDLGCLQSFFHHFCNTNKRSHPLIYTRESSQKTWVLSFYHFLLYGEVQALLLNMMILACNLSNHQFNLFSPEPLDMSLEEIVCLKVRTFVEKKRI